MPVASDTYSKLCAEPFHFPAEVTPFLRSSCGVKSRAALERTRLRFARITAQSVGGREFAVRSVAAALFGTSGFGEWQGSFRRYSESACQIIPAMGKELAGRPEDQACPTETRPGVALALALSRAIHHRDDIGASAESTIPVV